MRTTIIGPVSKSQILALKIKTVDFWINIFNPWLYCPSLFTQELKNQKLINSLWADRKYI